jgi:glutathione peroxidase
MKRLALLLFACFSTFAMANLYEIPLKDIDGKEVTLKAYEGKVLLVVNVASQCGLTPQYQALQALQEKYAGKGFTVLGFPCNDFGSQEPGSNDEIKQFCSTKYKVSFPLFDKIHVKGADQHPLYQKLSGKDGAFPGDVKWNFGKFLIGRDGKPLARFEPGTTPDDAALLKAVDEALAAK